MGRKDRSGMSGGFKSFSDTAVSGWSYDDDDRDGSEQVKFFKDNSNFDELIQSMNHDQRDAFRSWATGCFMDGEQYEGWDNMGSRSKRLTQTYDDILDQTTLKKGVELTRRSDAQLVLGAGHRSPSLEALRAMEGEVITSKGSMSFGAASEGLTIGDSGKKVEYKLRIPGGVNSKGAGMWIGDKRINGWGPEQREFMTNRDISLKVGKTTYNKNRGIYTVEIEYLGVMDHDYGTSGRLRR